MPYPRDHKEKTRARIVTSARALFNRHGFDQVTIDQVMAHAGLTRGGFYHHFKSKQDLYSEAVASIAGCSPFSRELARSRGVQRSPGEVADMLVDMYLADDTLKNIDDQCPLYALPSDVARSGRAPRAEYTKIIERMASVFRADGERSDEALAAVALCVGGMVLARTTHDAALAKRLRVAARAAAHDLLQATRAEDVAKYASTRSAARRPSAIAHTTSD
jgi:TetR/AcrR family transcriptional regulator, transcriptional repressor for nem operon